MVRGQIAEQLENVEYSYKFVSGEAQLVEISGCAKLHSFVIGKSTSGQLITILDSAISGRFLSAGVNVVGFIFGSPLNVPVQINYDVELKSGLVLLTSGNTWNYTVTYK